MTKNLNLVARQREIKILKDVESSEQSEFIALYGRRRIGKTYLINQYFKDHPFYFRFTGTKKLSFKEQLIKFHRKLKKLGGQQGIKLSSVPKNWDEALDQLSEIIEKTKTDSDQKKVIFFDEIPWIASRKSGFKEALDYFWNDFLNNRNDVILIVCGSSASWMIKHFVEDKGGFHNRLTRSPIGMRPFTLKETAEYLEFRRIDMNIENICELYMATGGVAHYLKMLNSEESPTQFINRNYFGPDGELQKEYYRLFRSLFDNHQTHLSVVKALAAHPSGYTLSELLSILKMKRGGGFTDILEELEQSDFICFTPKLGKAKKEGVYRLIDEFTLFYLTWVKPLGKSNQDPYYWEKQIQKPRHSTWLGYAFENICFKHSEQIKKKLNLTILATKVYGFRSKDAQIDMVIERSDKHVNLCEMKYTADPFEMNQAEAEKIKKRKTILSAQLKSKVRIIVTLVTPLEAKKNRHYLGVVNDQVNLPDLFAF